MFLFVHGNNYIFVHNLIYSYIFLKAAEAFGNRWLWSIRYSVISTKILATTQEYFNPTSTYLKITVVYSYMFCWQFKARSTRNILAVRALIRSFPINNFLNPLDFGIRILIIFQNNFTWINCKSWVTPIRKHACSLTTIWAFISWFAQLTTLRSIFWSIRSFHLIIKFQKYKNIKL